MRSSTGRARSRPGHSRATGDVRAQLHPAPALGSLGVSATAAGPYTAKPEKQGPESDPPGGLGDPEGGRAVLPEGGGPSVSADRTGVAIGPRGPGLPHGHPGGGDAAPGPGRGGLQGADDPAGGMRRAHLGPGGEPPAVPRGVQGPHGPHWRPRR